MLYTEEEREGGQRNALNEKSAFSGDTENVQYKDLCDVTSLTDQTVRDTRERKYVEKPLSQKIQAFEPVLEDAKEKIRMLETALKDTKLVLQGLAQHIEEMQRGI
ncbi:hypothetical protein Pfo_025600 [Paulownia fortunei]|nr:hypothetical protein Pfo_025600 [Paulownia fortunei]